MDCLRKEVKENLLIPKFAQYCFPVPQPGKLYLDRVLRDQLGFLGNLRKMVPSSLYEPSFMREGTLEISQHMEISTESKRGAISVLSHLTYPDLLLWMNENLPSNSSLGFFANMNSLVRHYLTSCNTQVKKTFICDTSEIAIGKSIGITQKEINLMYGRVKLDLDSHPTKKVEGVIATFVPWMLSTAVVNVCKIKNGLRKSLDNVHESLLASVSLGTLLENIRGSQNLVRREIGLLLLMERTTANLLECSSSIRDLGDKMGKAEFTEIYSKTKAVCDHLDAFRGGKIRKVVDKKGIPFFIYASVMKTELNTLQDIAGFVRRIINEQLVSAKVLRDLGKLMAARRGVYRRIIDVGRKWKVR